LLTTKKLLEDSSHQSSPNAASGKNHLKAAFIFNLGTLLVSLNFLSSKFIYLRNPEIQTS
jgi:hypothetical protein